MTNYIALSGTWIGRFVYGPEFGKDMHGERVQFRFFLEDLENGQFKGTSVDIEGPGANMNTATIRGFLTGDFISFTKQYPQYFIIDENGMTLVDTSKPQPRLSYSGQYNSRMKSFRGEWELWANEELAGESSIVDIFTGTWEMTRDNS